MGRLWSTLTDHLQNVSSRESESVVATEEFEQEKEIEQVARSQSRYDLEEDDQVREKAACYLQNHRTPCSHYAITWILVTQTSRHLAKRGNTHVLHAGEGGKALAAVLACKFESFSRWWRTTANHLRSVLVVESISRHALDLFQGTTHIVIGRLHLEHAKA
jgi:hypothetical protein